MGYLVGQWWFLVLLHMPARAVWRLEEPLIPHETHLEKGRLTAIDRGRLQKRYDHLL